MFFKKKKPTIRHIEDDNKFLFLKKIWVGKKVISISNGYQVNENDNCLNIGKVIDIVRINTNSNPLPLVKFSDEIKLCFSTIIEYSDEIFDICNKLTAKERYLFVMSIVQRFN